jgi:hypothetical protein
VSSPMLPAAESLILTPADDVTTAADRVALIVRNWHDTVHPGSWRFCDQQPCDAVRREVDSPLASGAPLAGSVAVALVDIADPEIDD